MAFVVQPSLPSSSRKFSSSQTEAPAPLTTKSSSPSPQPPAPPSSFCIYEFDSSRDLIWVAPYSMSPWVTGLFHIMSSGFIHIVACVRISLFFLRWLRLHCMDRPYLVSPSSLRKKCWWMLWSFLPLGYCEWCRCEHGCIPISLRLCFNSFGHSIPRMDLLDHLVILYSIFWRTAILFSTEAVPFYIPTDGAEASSVSPSSPKHCFMWFWL